MATSKLRLAVFLSLGAVLLPQSPGAADLSCIKHVVVLTLENRSFDSLYGCFPGVRGFNDENALVMRSGLSSLYQPVNGGYILPIHSTNQCLTDADHTRATGLMVWDGGWWDGWVTNKGLASMVYRDRQQLPFYYALAEAYTICDAFHCSMFAPTIPNRIYQVSGMIDPHGTGRGPALQNQPPSGGYTWTTYPERLEQAGITWRVYQQATNYIPMNPLICFSQFVNAPAASPLYSRGVQLVTDLVTAFESDVTNGTLPQISWIIPPWTYSEHPPFSAASGQWLTKQLLDVLFSNPQVYNSTVFFVTYDEEGGFFDHVPPPVPPPGTLDEFVDGQPIGLGVRVPMIIVSPWTRGGFVCSQLFDHTSILQFLENWTGVREPNISAWRRQACGDMMAAFDFEHPDTTCPSLPSVDPIICTNGYVPAVPFPQIPPIQERGMLAPRLLPYQLNAIASLDCVSNQLCVTMTNGGSASAHFSIYANDNRSDGPWQYDVSRGNSVAAYFSTTNVSGLYDLTCYGPNGFNRRFRGNTMASCAALEVAALLDVDAGAISLVLQNNSSSSVDLAITNVHESSLTTLTVPTNTTLLHYIGTTNSGGAYDLMATTTADADFLRRIAGRLELGPPILCATLTNGILQLSYPSRAAAWVLECKTNLSSGIWFAPPQTAVVQGSRALLELPINPGPAFFRLRQ